jgi:Flp pilus assembly protein TadB
MIMFALIFSILALGGAAYAFMRWQDSQALTRQRNCEATASYEENSHFCD